MNRLTIGDTPCDNTPIDGGRPVTTLAIPSKKVHYPESDGEPMADNTVQFTWIAILKWNLEHLFAKNPSVFVAGDHLIYPVEGNNLIRQAPDVYVAFGPLKGDRGCFKVFEEGGVFPQVVFEVWSPGNRTTRMEKKRKFYEKYGAEEYYIIYPDEPAGLEGWTRQGGKLVPIDEMNGIISPLLGIRFEADELDVRVYGPDGREFLSPEEIARDRDLAQRELELERARAEAERQRAEAERQRKEVLAAKLRELGVDPDTL